MEHKAKSLSQKLKEEFLKTGLVDDAVLNNRINAIIDELSDYQEEMEYLNRELVQNSNTVVIRWKTDGTIISFNEYALHFFGYNSDEVIGRPISIIVPEMDSRGIDLTALVQNIAAQPEKFIRVINENICSDGRLVWLAWTNKAIFDHEGKVSEILAVGIDITDFKMAEFNLLQSEQRFITLFRSNPTPSGITRESDYRIADVNDAWCKLTGYSREEAIGHNAVELGLAKPETLDKIRNIIQSLNTIQPTEIQLFTRFGEERNVLINAELIEIGGEKYVINNLVDITQRRMAEKHLAENEKRYRQLFENMNSGVAVYKVVNDGEDFIFSDFNNAGERIDGDKREDLIGRSIFEMRPGVKEFGLIEAMREVWKSGQPVFLPATHYKDHRLDAWYENFIYRISPDEIVTVFENISDRKHAEESLLRREMLLNEMGRIARIGGWELDCATMQQEWTDETYAIHDREKGIYNPNSAEELSRFEPGSKELIEKAFEAAIFKGIPYDMELEMTTVKENRKWVRAVCSPVITNGNVSKLTGTVQDITKRKLAEKEVAETRKLFQSLFNFSPVAYSLARFDDRRIVDVNNAWEVLFGYAKEEVIGYLGTDFNLWQSSVDRNADFQKFKREGKLLNHEVRIQTKTGELRSVSMFTDIIVQDGINYIFSVFVDITERKLAGEKLSKLAERLNLATNSAQIGIWDWNVQKNELVWDDQMIALYGLQPDDFKGAYEAWLNGVHPDDRKESDNISQKALRGECEYNTEFRVLWPDGSVHWLKADGTVFRDSNGTPVRMVGVNYDITERKQAEKNLKQWADTFENVAFGFVIGEPDNPNMGLMNPAFARMHGYTVGELTGIPITQVFAPEYRKELAEHIKIAHEKGHNVWESVHIRKDGSSFPVLIDAAVVKDPNGKVLYRIVSVQDITERKLAEKRRNESEERYRKLAENFPDTTITFYNRDLKVTFVTGQELNKTGYSAEDFIGKRYDEILIPLLAAEAKKSFEKAFTGEINTFEGKSYNDRFIKIVSVPVYDSEGTINEIQVISQNITESKKAEHERLISEQKYTLLFDNSGTPSLVFNMPEGIISEVNRKVEEFTGYSREELIGKNSIQAGIVMPEYRSKVLEILTRNEILYDFELPVKTKNGEIKTVLVNAVHFNIDEKRYIIATWFDITELKNAVDSLAENERRLRKTIETTSDGFWIVDTQRRFVEVNEAYCIMSGYSRQELLSMNIQDVEAVEAENDTDERIQKIVKRGATGLKHSTGEKTEPFSMWRSV